MTKRMVLGYFEYIAVLFFILDSSTVYSTAFDIDFHIAEIAAVLLTVCLALRLLLSGIKRTTLKKYLNRISVYYAIILFLLVMSVSAEHMVSYIARFVLVLPILILYFYCLAERGEALSLIHKYINTMAVLSAISLFFWVFASQLHLIAPTGSMRSGWGAAQYGYAYPSYFGLYFERQRTTFLWYSGFRNQGVFAEGPMHSVCLVLAIAAELFLPKQEARKIVRFSLGRGKSIYINWKLLCLIITLITTFTTTGQVLLILMLVFRYFMGRPKMQFNYLIKLLGGFTLTAIGAYAAISIFLLKSTSFSWIGRVDDFISGFRAWLDSPIWGHGYGDIMVTNAYRVSRWETGAEAGASNSITQVLVQGGLLLLLVYIWPVYSAVRRALQQRNPGILMLTAILMLEFIFTVCAYRLGVTLFFAFLYGMSIAAPPLKFVQKVDNGRQRMKTG